MQILLVVPIRDIDALVASDRVWVDGLCRRDAVLPLLLHRCVHDQQRVVRQVNRDLALRVSASGIGRLLHLLVGGGAVVACYDLADAEFTRDA